MGLLAGIYECKSIGNCSNGGISAEHVRVCVVNAEGPFEPHETSPGVRVIQHPAGRKYGLIAVPIDLPPEAKSVGPMAGGTHIGTSDSRMSALLRSLGSSDPYGLISLHDRFETPAENELLSR